MIISFTHDQYFIWKHSQERKLISVGDLIISNVDVTDKKENV